MYIILAIDYLWFSLNYKNIIMDKTKLIGGLYGFRAEKSFGTPGILPDHHSDIDDSLYSFFYFLACHTTFLSEYFC